MAMRMRIVARTLPESDEVEKRKLHAFDTEKPVHAERDAGQAYVAYATRSRSVSRLFLKTVGFFFPRLVRFPLCPALQRVLEFPNRSRFLL